MSLMDLLVAPATEEEDEEEEEHEEEKEEEEQAGVVGIPKLVGVMGEAVADVAGWEGAATAGAVDVLLPPRLGGRDVKWRPHGAITASQAPLSVSRIICHGHVGRAGLAIKGET